MRWRWIVTGVVACGAPSDPPTLQGRMPEVPPACDAQDFPVEVRGSAFTPDGVPLPDVAVRAWDEGAARWTEVARTAANGRFRFESPGPVTVDVGAWRTQPAHLCVGVPGEAEMVLPEDAAVEMIVGGNEFLGPRTCAWRLEVPGVTGEADVVFQRPTERAHQTAVADGGAVTVTLPCDVEAVAVLAAPVGSAPGALGGLHPVDVGGGTRKLPPGPVEAIRVTAADPEGAPVAGATVHDAVHDAVLPASGRGVFRTWPDARVVVRADGRMPAWTGPDGSARAVRGGGTLAATLSDAHFVAVRCPDRVDAWCPFEPTCRPADDDVSPPSPCGRDDGGLVMCACPEGQAIVEAPGFAVPVEPGDHRIEVDLGMLPGRITLDAGSRDCTVEARRAPRFTDAWFDPPRFHHTQGRCDARGRVDLGPVPDGRWTLQIRAAGRRWTTVVDVEGAPVDLGRVAPPGD